jgi:hypothetical protein
MTIVPFLPLRRLERLAAWTSRESVVAGAAVCCAGCVCASFFGSSAKIGSASAPVSEMIKARFIGRLRLALM